MSWPTTNEVQRANAGEISVAPVGHIAAQTTEAQITEAHRPIADPPEAPTEIGRLLEVHHVVTAPPRVTAPLRVTAPAGAIVTRVVMARPVVTAPLRVTALGAEIVRRVPLGERALLPPRAAHRVVTADRGATARPEARATAVVAAPRVGARAMAEATRAIARSAPLGVNETAETRDPSRHAWTSPMFQRT